MFRQSMAFPPPIHGSDTPPLQQQQQPSPQPVNATESSRQQQQLIAASSSSSPVKSHPLHNFPLSDLKWAMNHTNTHRLRKSSGRSPLHDTTRNLVIEEEVKEEASGSSSFEFKSKNKEIVTGLIDSTAADRSGTKSTDGRSKILIRIRTKETPINNSSTVADESQRISDGNEDEFGPKIWNLRPRKPPPTMKKKHSIGILKSCSNQGTIRTEAIRSKNSADAAAKISITERKEKKKPRLAISLSKLEIDEDIYALTGSKPSRRPKKRAKNLQKQLDVLFPGLWMGNVSSDAYKVSEHA